ncbi:hypothetical protein BOTBODRAFT_50094 [Botryobasidium botryosum FD-172 SS1]|uniref:Uncharacterized protein n=1 Tax=Botryobasidium botryosum (strain FD-172 SS1) TaxID=930990 RepID=A0A067N0D7_BOTB1|nr:hypothetical protein BOTBODRAFT_50094 [Botryobasidium botryosum FD-172 SS1]
MNHALLSPCPCTDTLSSLKHERFTYTPSAPYSSHSYPNLPMTVLSELLVALMFSALALAKGGGGGGHGGGGHAEGAIGASHGASGGGGGGSGGDLCPHCPKGKKIGVYAAAYGGLFISAFLLVFCCRMLSYRASLRRQMADEESRARSDCSEPTNEGYPALEGRLGAPPAYTVADEKDVYVSMPGDPPRCALSPKTYNMPPIPVLPLHRLPVP